HLLVLAVAADAPGQERHRAATVRPDPTNVRKAHGVAVENYARDGAGRVGSVLHARRLYTGSVVKAPATGSGGRVDKDDGGAQVELLHHRPVGRVTEPSVVVARHEADAICFERVVGVLDLFQRGVDVGEGHRREQ